MSKLDYARAALLGIIQGLTEFLPVSSSGHLAIAQRWLACDPGGPPMLLFDVLVHVGTLAAVGWVFAGSFHRFLRRLTRESSRSWPHRRHAWRIVFLAVAATIPTAAIGLLFKREFEAAFDRPRSIGLGLLITAVLLAITAWLPRQGRGWKAFYGWQAVLVGVAQASAILPGISRSGATICVATFCGLHRRWAAEFSFLIAIPPILGGAALKLNDAFQLPPAQLADLPWGPIIGGAFVALVTGIFALKLLLSVVRRAKLHYFALYCGLLGLLIFQVDR